MMRHYIALIRKDVGPDFGVSFPDLPGCITAGSTLDEAHAFADEALALHLQGKAEDKEPVPEPSSLETIMTDAQNRDGVAILAPYARTPRPYASTLPCQPTSSIGSTPAPNSAA